MNDDFTINAKAQSIENLYVSIITNEHPTLIANSKKIQDAYCATGYFCCGPCDCYSEGNPGCNQWWTPWWELTPPCYYDPVREATDKTLEKIRKMEDELLGWRAKARLTNNSALIFSNERASEIVHDEIVDSTEAIFAGMIYTMLEAGAIGGAIVGATQAFYSILNTITSDANWFLKNVKPYNPGGGGGLS